MAKSPAKLKLKYRAPGVFDLVEGRTVIETVSRRDVETKVETLATAPGVPMEAAYAAARDLLVLFPERDASLEDLIAFADETGVGFPRRPADAGYAWEMIFAETNVVSDSLVGSDVQLSTDRDDSAAPGGAIGEVDLPDDGDEDAATELKTGLETDDE